MHVLDKMTHANRHTNQMSFCSIKEGKILDNFKHGCQYQGCFTGDYLALPGIDKGNKDSIQRVSLLKDN